MSAAIISDCGRYRYRLEREGLVERLRTRKLPHGRSMSSGEMSMCMSEAAATIQSLQSMLAEAKEALGLCAAQLQIERDHLFDCCTVAGDPETLDDPAKPDIVRMDTALSKARTTLRKLDGEREDG